MVSLSGGKEKPTLLYSGWKDKSWVTKRHGVAWDRKRERHRGRTGQDRKGRKGEAQRKGQSRKGSVRRHKAGQVGRRVRTRQRKNRKYFYMCVIGGADWPQGPEGKFLSEGLSTQKCLSPTTKTLWRTAPWLTKLWSTQGGWMSLKLPALKIRDICRTQRERERK